KIDFEPKESGISAGITCYYSTATYVRCGISYQDGKCIELVINRNKGEEVIARADDIKSGELYLCVKVRNLTRTFYYSYDNKEWFLIGTLENCIYLCDEGVPEDRKRHTGTLTGIYAISDAPEKHISADFDFFDYSNVSL
ncbi:MAG: glycoside hydrolase family 43 protein, partial [Firmicutes bacterium]|nr:glycoside hydrolase family 43 protein [Bacillota bacterium]